MGIEDGKLYLGNIDILDGTPLLDIKPYVPEMDQPQNVQIGWLESAKKRIRDQESDDRFQ
jgi:tRNA (Thr-GGU) A37 N-methylase